MGNSMGDLISRSALIEKMNDFAVFAAIYKPYMSKDDIAQNVLDQAKIQAIRLVNEAPAVEAEPVVRGSWIYNRYHTWECSECGFHPFKGYIPANPNFKRCPECGAKMDGDVSDD